MYHVPHFINGKALAEKEGLPLFNPATGEQTGTVASNPAAVDQAVQAAKAAFVDWQTTSVYARAKILFRYRSLVENEISSLSALITKEHGKTLAEAAGSIQRGLEVLDYACGAPGHLQGLFSASIATGVDAYSLHQPLGVCVGITPFNFPAMIGLWMFPLALACGNTFIWKPSEKDPSVSIRLAELAMEAGFPKGVLNVVQGGKETVEALLVHPDIKAVSFVGSSLVAEHVYKTAIANNKRAQAFGGAKNHCLVMPDADINQAGEAIFASAYGSAGERCMAISAVLVIGDQKADELVAYLQQRLAQIKIGAGDQPDIEMGPVVTAVHRERVQQYIEIGKAEGAKLVFDGSQAQWESRPGFFMGAYLFDQVKPPMKIYREEIFGPVLSVVRVPDLHAALTLINEHEYGNGVSIFTQDGKAAREFANKVQVGMVGINVPVPVPAAYHSFGGWKRSIFADIGMYGSEAIRFYTKLKTVTTRWV
jgi:malonate-semialdehyde dehydrogenase (acetylating) / methylmalonate-semialdehyde dehydrogenase